mmetsp:Transcript_24623/g.44679  ORF Transcript_24623/g.44679 Transcript_24623/m.44679 type:complete len:99 (-) Transcript_24623:311-607(-)
MLNEKYDNRVMVGWTAKGVINNDFMIQKYVPNLSGGVGSDALGMVVMDSASAHCTEIVKNKFESSDLLPTVIPGGITSRVHFVDTDYAPTHRSLHGRY